jgi:hypothetical protein
LDDFKLRASYGSIGNQNISPYGFIASMGIGQSNVWLDGGDKVTVIGVIAQFFGRKVRAGKSSALWKAQIGEEFMQG